MSPSSVDRPQQQQHPLMVQDTMDNERLIAAVAAYPELYDTSLNPYRDGQRKDSIWNMIACNMKHSSAECKTRWKNLRDSFVKILRSGGVTKRGIAKRPWRYAKQMEFLVPFVQIKRSSNGYRHRKDARRPPPRPLTAAGRCEGLHVGVDTAELPPLPTSSITDDGDGDGGGWNERVSCDELRLPRSCSPTATAERRRDCALPLSACDARSSPSPSLRVDSVQFAAAAARAGLGLFDVLCPTDRQMTLKSGSGDESSSDDEDELFMKSLVPCLRRLPPPKRSYAKLIIQQLLYELQYYT
ncbi:unnamed protein product [Soboliphyme baturini]|uniref:MADF domain-containing protein n=1 Tax=Soboliphyme baturini TaxID=241478 RepID=A0A183IMQ3_9BILA|nr:unnamed protein product [Soboliphyme baturini]